MSNSKTFRLFISSTFNDFRKEREVLQTIVFPHAKEYCSQRGYTFQPIDLRWGVSNEAQLDQKTLELCLSEVRACKSHIHPNFLIMIGDRYGWIPLPYAIEEKEFETLLALIDSNEEKQLLQEWYKLDLNQLPASYILKERSGEYEEFEKWLVVETNIRTILQSVVNNSNLNAEQKRKYFLSATEAEVEEGIIPYIKPTKFQTEQLLSKDSTLQTVDTEHIFGFFRDIDKSTQIENKFIMDDYEEAQLFKKRVANELIENNILHVETTQTDKESLEETYLKEFEARMIKFLESQIDAHKEKKTEEKLTPLEIELQAQSYFAQTKRKDFLATEPLKELLDIIQTYISDNNQEPLVIYGASGRGKSSLMAKAIQEAEDKKNKKVIYRFVGATPHASSSKELLISLFDELEVDLRIEGDDSTIHKKKTTQISNAIFKEMSEASSPEELDRLFSKLSPDELQSVMFMLDMDADKQRVVDNTGKLYQSPNLKEEQKKINEFNQLVCKKINDIIEDVIIFIDAVDQLTNDDNFSWLPQELPSNVKIVISALDDAKYFVDSKYFRLLSKKIKEKNIYKLDVFIEDKQLVKNLLEKEQRVLQKHQMDYFLEQFSQVQTPLYTSVAISELKHWKSYDEIKCQGNLGTKTPTVQSLQNTQEGLVNEFIGNLSKLHHHNKNFVHKVLAYLYASQDGLSENELLELLEVDEEFVKLMADEKFHKNHTLELPLVHWTRLYSQLKLFLSLKAQDGEELMYFFHREFETAIANLPNLREEHERIIYATQKLLLKKKNNDFNSNRLGKLYATLITQYELRYFTQEEQKHRLEDKSTQKKFAEFILNMDSDKFIEEYLIDFQKRGYKHHVADQLFQAKAFFESSFHAIKKLYFNDNKWLELYTFLLHNINSVYKEWNLPIEYEEEYVRMINLLYKSNPQIWIDDYISGLDSLTRSYTNIDFEEKSIEARIEASLLCEKGHHDNIYKQLWNYSSRLDILSNVLRMAERRDEARDFEVKYLNAIDEIYLTDPSSEAEAYIIELTSFAQNKAVNIDEKIELYKKCVDISEKYIQRLYPVSLARLSWAYEEASDFNQAILYRKKNLATKSFGKNRGDTQSYLDSSKELISLLKKAEYTDEQSQEEFKIIEIYDELFISDSEAWSEEYLMVLDELIVTLANQNNGSTLDKLADKKLNVIRFLYKKNPNQWSKSYVPFLNNLALAYDKKNRLDKSIPLHEEVLQIIKDLYIKTPKNWTQNYTTSLSNLANAYYRKSRLDEAILLEEEIFQLIEKVYKENPEKWVNEYLESLNNLAFFYDKKRYFSEARVLYKEVLRIMKELYKEKQEEWMKKYIISLNNLAFSYYNESLLDEAIPLYEELYQIRKEHYKEELYKWAQNDMKFLEYLLDCYYATNRLNEGRLLEGEILRIRKE